MMADDLALLCVGLRFLASGTQVQRAQLSPASRGTQEGGGRVRVGCRRQQVL